LPSFGSRPADLQIELARKALASRAEDEVKAASMHEPWSAHRRLEPGDRRAGGVDQQRRDDDGGGGNVGLAER
jgi:hypothetical protein